MLKYRALYERYRGLIADGTYAPGERLPSLRDVARAEGLGLNTVRAAFDLLEADGVARGFERGGYYARFRSYRGGSLAAYVPPAECREAEGLSASQKIEYLLAAGGASSGFALAEPDSSLLPVARLERLFATLKGSWIDYGDQSGEAELRRRITAAYHPYHGALEGEDIVVTNGATSSSRATSWPWSRRPTTIISGSSRPRARGLSRCPSARAAAWTSTSSRRGYAATAPRGREGSG